MRSDDTMNIFKYDELILLLGSSDLTRKGKIKRKKTRGNLRQLARLLLTVRKNQMMLSLQLWDLITAARFDAVVKATRELAIPR